MQAALQRLRRPFFGQNWVAGASIGPKATDFAQKMALEGADGQAALEIRRQADLNDARKRRRSLSADRRRGWARGGLPRTASPRAPPPEARRAEERGRTPRRTPPIFTPRATPEAQGERAPASEFHPEPSRGRRRRDGGARNGQPPAQAAPSRASGWAVAEAGAASPERREAEQGSA